MFLLYCKDPPPGKSPDEFCDDVLDLANLLNRSGGLICKCDHYYTHEANWSVWTEKMIKESDAVLLVCSPMMVHHLQEPSHQLVEMTMGRFYADSIPNYINPAKFIPVFLNNKRQLHLVPTKLHAATHYDLRVSELISRMGDTSGMTAERFAKQVTKLLEEPVFRDIAALLTFLRREPPLSPPPCPQPIPIPPIPRPGIIVPDTAFLYRVFTTVEPLQLGLPECTNTQSLFHPATDLI